MSNNKFVVITRQSYNNINDALTQLKINKQHNTTATIQVKQQNLPLTHILDDKELYYYLKAKIIDTRLTVITFIIAKELLITDKQIQEIYDCGNGKYLFDNQEFLLISSYDYSLLSDDDRCNLDDLYGGLWLEYESFFNRYRVYKRIR